MGSVEPLFLPQIDHESLGNGVSDVPDFKIFWGACTRTPLACRASSAHKFEPSFTKSWIRHVACGNLPLTGPYQYGTAGELGPHTDVTSTKMHKNVDMTALVGMNQQDGGYVNT